MIWLTNDSSSRCMTWQWSMMTLNLLFRLGEKQQWGNESVSCLCRCERSSTRAKHYKLLRFSSSVPETMEEFCCGADVTDNSCYCFSAECYLCAILTFCWHLFFFFFKDSLPTHTCKYLLLPNKCQSKVGTVDFCSLEFLCELERCWRESVCVLLWVSFCCNSFFMKTYCT